MTSTTQNNRTLPHTSQESEQHETERGKADPTFIGTEQAQTVQDVVGFRSEGREPMRVMDQPTSDLRLATSLRPVQEHIHSIEKFVSRPVKIATIDWKTSHTMGQNIGVYDIIRELNNPNMEMTRQKLAGFYGIHTTAHLKVVVNSQVFQQGLLQIYYVPYQKTFTAFPPAFNDTKLSAVFGSGCPNVILNLATAQSGELSVPYTGSNAFVHVPSLVEGKRDWGTFYVQSLVPVSDNTNASTADISVYMFFTGIKTFGATPVVWKCQGDREDESLLKTAGNLVGKVSSGGVVGALPEILDALGLSKPVANQSPARMVLSPFANIGLTDSTSAAFKLSASRKQDTMVEPLGVQQQDEMDIQNVITKDCIRTQFTWATSQKAGSELTRITVNPNSTISESKSIQSIEYTLIATSRLRYVSDMFRYWRGGILYTFHVACTKMHSGRLRLVYNVGGTMDSSEIAKKLPYVFSQVVDIKDGVTFKVRCPYFASTPWRHVPSKWNASNQRFDLDHTDDYDDLENNLTIYVENALKVASNANPTITIVVTEEADKDFEFAAPVAPIHPPAYIAAPTTSRKQRSIKDPLSPEFQKQHQARDGPPLSNINVVPRVKTVPETFQFQAPLDMPIIEMVPSNVLSPIQKAQAHESTMGEKITNLRPLLKRYFPIGTQEIDQQSYAVGVVFPHAVMQDVVSTTQRTSQYYDYFSYLSHMYRFYRGGMRILFAMDGQPATKSAIRYTPNHHITLNPFTNGTEDVFGPHAPAFALNPPTASDRKSFFQLPMSVSLPFLPSLQGGMEIEFPYYSKSHKLPIFLSTKSVAEIVTLADEQFLPDGFLSYMFDRSSAPNTNKAFVDMYRAVADDFNFGFLLGSPPVVTTQPPFT